MDLVTETQIQGVGELLQGVLSPDNSLRTGKEGEIHTLRMQHPNELVLCLTYILRSHPDATVKTLASVLLRQMFSNLSPQQLQVWARLSQTVQETVKSALLDVAKSESLLLLKKKAGEVIAELCVNIMAGDEPGTWPALMPFLLGNVLSEDALQIAMGFHVLTGLFTFFHEELMKQKETLLQVYTRHLESANAEVRVECVDSLCSLWCIIELPDAEFFAGLFPQVLASILWLVTEDPQKAEKALKSLREFAESEPKFLKPRLDSVFSFVEQIYSSPTENLYLKYQALDVVVTVAERLEEYFRNNPSASNTICEKTFKIMISNAPEVDELWATPPEGFQESDEEEDPVEVDYALLGRKLLSRMLTNIGDTLLMPGLLAMVKDSLDPAVTDWRIRYAALLTITELAEFIQEPAKVAELVPILQTHFDLNAHPKIRYAVTLCIARLSIDYEEQFQTAHHAAVMPLLLAGLEDPVQRVAAGACKALSKFLDNAGQTLASGYAPAVLPKLVERFSAHNCSFVKEKALGTVMALAESCRTAFSAYYEQSMKYLYEIINTYTRPEHTKLRGKAIETMSIICNSIGKKAFMPYADGVITLFKTIHASTAQGEPLNANLLSAWQKLSATLGPDFAHHLQDIVPHLLRSISSHSEASLSTDPGTPIDLLSLLKSDKKKVSVTTTDIENKELALHTLNIIVEILQGAYAPYVQETAIVVLPLVEYTVNETVRSYSASLCANLVISIKKSNHPDSAASGITAARTFLGKLWLATEKEHDLETLVSQLNSIKTLIEAPGVEFLSAEEVNSTGEHMMKILDASLKRRARNAEICEEFSDGEEGEDEMITELNNKDEDSLHTAISDVLGALFKSHRTLSLSIVEYLYTNVFSKFLTPESPVNDQKFAIFVIDDIIEFVGQDLASTKWSSLAEALVRFVVHADESIRQAAAYGLGILASCSSGEAYGPWAATILQALNAALALPLGKSKSKYAHARDNVIAAVGKIIKHQPGCTDLPGVVPSFISVLPLTHDKEEARLAHDLLIEMCLVSAGLWIGANNERLEPVVKTLANILESKLVSQDTVPKIKQFFTVLKWEDPTVNAVWGGLTELQKTKVTHLLTN